MDVLWSRGESTVSEVVDAVSRREPLAYSTVLTTLRILENKGYLTHKKSGRAFVYTPVVDRSQARRKALKHILLRFFNNSPELLVLNILKEESIDPGELDRIKKKIQETE
jgi:predicted transcriptional regulator